MPFPVGNDKDFGEYLDDREEALERLPTLSDSDWTIVDSSSSTSTPITPTLGSPTSAVRSRSLSSTGSIHSNSSVSGGNTSSIKILSSSLSYVTFNLLPTSSIFVAWKLNLLLPTSEVSTLTSLLSSLEVRLGRRIIPKFSNKKSGTRDEAARLFPLLLPKDSTSIYSESDIKRNDLGMNSGVTKIEVGGWLEVEKDLVEASQACNGSTKTYLKASLKEPGLKMNAGDGVILGIEVELFRSSLEQSQISNSTTSGTSRISTAPSSNSSGSRNSSSVFSKSSSPSSSTGTSGGNFNPFSCRLNSSSTFNSAGSLTSSPSPDILKKMRNSSSFSDSATYHSRFSMSSDGAETIRSVGTELFP